MAGKLDNALYRKLTAGLLLTSGTGSRYRLIASAAARQAGLAAAA